MSFCDLTNFARPSTEVQMDLENTYDNKTEFNDSTFETLRNLLFIKSLYTSL